MNSESTNSLSQITPLQIGYTAIRDIANSIAAQTQLRQIQDLSLIIQGIGGNIIYQTPEEWSNKDANSLEVFGVKKFNIYMPQISSESMNNLIFAGAIGHYFLHAQEGKKPLFVKRFQQDLSNLEGLWFALCLLIPDNAFAIAQRQDESNDEVLAQIFKVTEPIIKLKRKIMKNATGSSLATQT